MLHASLASFVFMAFTAAYLAIRAHFARRARSLQKVDKGGTADRALIALVGIGQIVLPLVFVFTPVLAAADRPQPAGCTVVGILVMAIALWLFWRSHADLGDNWSVTLELNADEHRLVTDGVYRRVRHPMYTSFLLMGCGQALLLANWLAGPAGLLAVLVLVFVRVPREEAMMRGHFGDAYREYMRRTGAVTPRR
jgi:protein-S-isoprenylcysteine O-methyltransferase Ste14